MQVAWDTKWLNNPDEYNTVIKGTRTLEMPSELGRRFNPHAVQPRAGWEGVTETGEAPECSQDPGEESDGLLYLLQFQGSSKLAGVPGYMACVSLVSPHSPTQVLLFT